jgi:hypothetical protein
MRPQEDNGNAFSAGARVPSRLSFQAHALAKCTSGRAYLMGIVARPVRAGNPYNLSVCFLCVLDCVCSYWVKENPYVSLLTKPSQRDTLSPSRSCSRLDLENSRRKGSSVSELASLFFVFKKDISTVSLVSWKTGTPHVACMFPLVH